jgi:hypothetical protein
MRIQEAILYAIKDELISDLQDLNNALSQTPVIVSTTISSGDVIIGHPDFLPDRAITICVTPPDDDAAIENEHAYIELAHGFLVTVYTDIVVYVHPETIRVNDSVAYEFNQKILLARLADWIRTLFSGQNLVLTLQSKENRSTGDIAYGTVDSVDIYLAQRGAAGSVYAPCVHAALSHIVS